MATLPTVLKPVQPYLLISKQFGKRDPVVAYYCKRNVCYCATDTDTCGSVRGLHCIDIDLINIMGCGAGTAVSYV